jgi:hypothetical protein
MNIKTIPAFPVAFVQGSDPAGADVEPGERGMSLHQYYVGQALAGLSGTMEFLLAALNDAKAIEKATIQELIAKAAVRVADATIAELEGRIDKTNSDLTPTSGK